MTLLGSKLNEGTLIASRQQTELHIVFLSEFAMALQSPQFSLPRQLTAPQVHLIGSSVSSYSNCSSQQTPVRTHSTVFCYKSTIQMCPPELLLGAEAPVMTPSGIDFSAPFLPGLPSMRRDRDCMLDSCL